MKDNYEIEPDEEYQIDLAGNGVAPVPLPAASLLLMGGLGCLTLTRRKRKPA